MDAEDVRLQGRRLAGRYELEEEIASGGMGTVWRARDEVLGRPVAVKVLHERLVAEPGLLDRFRLEAVAAARLSHPAVVRVFDTGIDERVCYIVMELFEGRTLETMLADRRRLEPDEAVRIVGSALLGLGHAHRQGVVHRDVKPGNILIDRDGFVKVTDFGIAKAALAGEDLTTTGNLLGTAGYLAPEQVTGGPVDARTDLYAAGIVLYEALTGRTPFRGGTHIATATARLTTDPVPPRALRSGIPRELNQAVMRALAREPDERYRSAEEMGAALGEAVPTAARPAPPARDGGADRAPTRSSIRSWFVIPVAVLLVAALAVGGFWVLTRVLQEGGGTGGDGERPRPGALQASAVSTFDPPPGDGEEHDDTLPGATDGDRTSYWTTEGYHDPDMDKGGVGIVIGLSEPSEISAIRLRTDTPGFEFNIYTGDADDTFDLEAPIAAGTADSVTELELETGETRYVLLWITQLVQVDRYRAHVNEIDLFGP